MGFGEPNCTGISAPIELSYITSTISILLALVTFPGNLMVCLAIVLDPYKELRTPFNYLLLSLATTDLIVGAFMDPLSAVFHYIEATKLNLVSDKILSHSILNFDNCIAVNFGSTCYRPLHRRQVSAYVQDKAYI